MRYGFIFCHYKVCIEEKMAIVWFCVRFCGFLVLHWTALRLSENTDEKHGNSIGQLLETTLLSGSHSIHSMVSEVYHF